MRGGDGETLGLEILIEFLFSFHLGNLPGIFL
jgi:hypothetical protein